MRRVNSYLMVAQALLLATLAIGCITTSVINKAYDRYGNYVEITRVNEAGTLDDNLYLQLDVQQKGQLASRAVLIRIPVDDIGTYHRSVPAAPLEQADLRLEPPPLGYFESATSMPDGVVPIPVRYLDVDDHLELDDRVYALPVGVHVLIVRKLYGQPAPSDQESTSADGVLPAGAQILVVRRVPEHAPRQSSMGALDETPKKRRAWLFLTPFSVVGDIVTFPFQLIGALIIGS